MLQLDKNHTDKCHYKSPLITRTITIINNNHNYNPPSYMWWYFSFSHIQGVKIENLAEKKPSLTTVSLSVRGCTSLAAMLIFLLPEVSMETVELRESAVCMIIVDYDGKSQWLCRQIGSDPLPPHNTKICWSWSAIWLSYMWTEPGAPDWQEV